MKTAYTSKINILQVITILIAVASSWGLIPEEHKVKVLESLTLLTPLVTIILRTWFTSVPIKWGEDE